MSMRLTREDLVSLIDALDALAAVPADIKQVRVGNHEVILERFEAKNPGGSVSYIVRGITDRAIGTPAYRDQGTGMEVREAPRRR